MRNARLHTDAQSREDMVPLDRERGLHSSDTSSFCAKGAGVSNMASQLAGESCLQLFEECDQSLFWRDCLKSIWPSPLFFRLIAPHQWLFVYRMPPSQRNRL